MLPAHKPCGSKTLCHGEFLDGVAGIPTHTGLLARRTRTVTVETSDTELSQSSFSLLKKKKKHYHIPADIRDTVFTIKPKKMERP